jgi:DNA modification methylase
MALADISSFYSTELGQAYLGDSLELLDEVADNSVDLICTSPPFALLRKKAYGNVHATEYIDWFMQFARKFARVLKPDGSLVIDIGGTWVKGAPIRSLYHYELLLKLCASEEDGGGNFNLAQELYWYNPAKLPTPAEWVTVRRIRVKDAVNTVWWLSLSEFPKASNRRVLKPYSESQKKLMENGYKPKRRPSEHDISDKFGKNNKGAIPPNLIDGIEGDNSIGDPVPVNVISAANTSSNDQYLRLCRKHKIKPHPARFPRALPEFIIGLCSEENDVVLDPFAGSNMTGYVAETMKRRWLSFELIESYLEASKFRFLVEEDESSSQSDSSLEQKRLF